MPRTAITTSNKQTESRRAHALNAALEIFARYGYQKASMQDIAKKAGVSKSVLFKYFKTKEQLYLAAFQIAADGIYEADLKARADESTRGDIFAALRHTVDARMELFSRLPWVYSFSYTAAFDPDPFVRALVQQEYARRESSKTEQTAYAGLRRDIPEEAARKLIFWVSQGFLAEKLEHGIAEPEVLKREYEDWVSTLELLLKAKGETNR
jgi:TetR/AcrR family transcriptional regulator